MFIPFYTGRVIDILGGQYQQSEFLSALLFMGLYSLGRYSMRLVHQHESVVMLQVMRANEVCFVPQLSECRLQRRCPTLCYQFIHLQN